MFAPSRNITVNASTRSILQYPSSGKRDGVVVTAYAGAGSGTSGGAFQQNVVSSNATVPMLEGIMPSDKASRHKLFKDMYYHDAVSGGAVDVLSSFLGDFHLTGISDPSRMDKFSSTASSISPATLFPLITTEYLVHGHFVGTKLFDKSKGYITGITPHDVMSVNIKPINVHGAQPIFDLTLDEEFRALLRSEDPRVRDILNALPKMYRSAASDGSIPLMPQNTIFFPRQRLAGTPSGVSLYERTLPVYLIEKSLYRGTIDAANRRQRSILHAKVSGDGDDWVPDTQYLQQVNDRIKGADMDPQGAVMTTGDNISITQFMEPHNFWSIDQFAPFASEMKFYAYRISPSMINGTSSLATLDASLSIMVNDLRQYRSLFENKIMKESIFGDVAIANGFKDEDSHRNDSLSVEKRYGRQTFNLAEYEIPHVVWKQSLSPEGDSAYLNMLHEISQLGVPVNLSMYAAAAGLNLDDLLDGAEKDVDDRRRAQKYWRGIMKSSNALVEEEVRSDFALKQQRKEARMAMEVEREQGVSEVTANMAAYNSCKYNGLSKVPWSEREWDRDRQGFENTDNQGKYRTGTTEGRVLRRDRILKHVASKVAEERAKEAYQAKEDEWRRNHS